MGTSKRLAPLYDKYAAHKAIRVAAAAGPLQSLTRAELSLDRHPMTIYPRALQRHVRAWVRFGPEAVCVDARLLRSTGLAAGIEFKADDQVYRCWVWGNAVTVVDDDETGARR